MKTPLIRRSSLHATALLLCAAALPAQDRDARLSFPPGRIGEASAGATAAVPLRTVVAGGFDSSAGLNTVDGQLWGGADRYKVLLEADRITFTPALPAAPHNVPVEFRVISYGRGGDLRPVSPAVLTHRGLTASFLREEFVETWEMRAEGAKQSFRFDRLPDGRGDLVVRLRMTTDLQVETQGPDHLLLKLDGVGGMHIREVVGIDAEGWRIQGSLRFEAGELELRLPEAAVDRAALPLVLDPLVGNPFSVSALAHDGDPDLAYMNGDFLVVFQRRFSASDFDVHGQLVDHFTGNLEGPRLLIETAPGIQSGARVAPLGHHAFSTFCVVYRWDSGSSDDILARAVRWDGGGATTIGNRTTIADTGTDLGSPDVGGETTSDDELIVVWRDFTTGEIRAKEVTVVQNAAPTPPSLAPFQSTVLVAPAGATWANSAPAISKTGGDTGHHMIVWNRQPTRSTDTQVCGAIVSRDLDILESLIQAPARAGPGDRDQPDVDGDGHNWVVAYDLEATAGAGNADIAAFAVGWDPGAPMGAQGFLSSGEVIVQASAANEFGASVCSTDEGVLVTWTSAASSTAINTDVFGRLLDTFTCADCAGQLFAFGNSPDREISIRAAAYHADQARVLAVWTYQDITSPPAGAAPSIRGRLFDADDGHRLPVLVTQPIFGSGSCGGNTSYPSFSCMRVGNTSFALRLLEAPPSTPAFVLFGPLARRVRACGPCVVVPDFRDGFVGVTSTDGFGRASFPVPIFNNPSLSGVRVYVQWALPGTGCNGLSLSQAISAQID